MARPFPHPLAHLLHPMGNQVAVSPQQAEADDPEATVEARLEQERLLVAAQRAAAAADEADAAHDDGDDPAAPADGDEDEDDAAGASFSIRTAPAKVVFGTESLQDVRLQESYTSLAARIKSRLRLDNLADLRPEDLLQFLDPAKSAFASELQKGLRADLDDEIWAEYLYWYFLERHFRLLAFKVPSSSTELRETGSAFKQLIGAEIDHQQYMRLLKNLDSEFHEDGGDEQAWVLFEKAFNRDAAFFRTGRTKGEVVVVDDDKAHCEAKAALAAAGILGMTLGATKRWGLTRHGLNNAAFRFKLGIKIHQYGESVSSCLRSLLLLLGGADSVDHLKAKHGLSGKLLLFDRGYTDAEVLDLVIQCHGDFLGTMRRIKECPFTIDKGPVSGRREDFISAGCVTMRTATHIGGDDETFPSLIDRLRVMAFSNGRGTVTLMQNSDMRLDGYYGIERDIMVKAPTAPWDDAPKGIVLEDGGSELTGDALEAVKVLIGALGDVAAFLIVDQSSNGLWFYLRRNAITGRTLCRVIREAAAAGVAQFSTITKVTKALSGPTVAIAAAGGGGGGGAAAGAAAAGPLEMDFAPDANIHQHSIGGTTVDVARRALSKDWLKEQSDQVIADIFAKLPLRGFVTANYLPEQQRAKIHSWAEKRKGGKKEREAALAVLVSSELKAILTTTLSASVAADSNLLKSASAGGGVAKMREHILSNTKPPAGEEANDTPFAKLVNGSWFMKPVKHDARRNMVAGHENEAKTRKYLFSHNDATFGSGDYSFTIMKMFRTGIAARRASPFIRSSPDNIAVIDFSAGPDGWVEALSVADEFSGWVLALVEYKCATTAARITAEMKRLTDYHPIDASDLARSVAWVDMTTDDGAQQLAQVIPTLEDRAQLAQGAAAMGLLYSVWIMSKPDGTPVRMVVVRWDSDILDELMDLETDYVKLYVPWVMRPDTTPTRKDIMEACGTAPLRHARSVDAVLEQLQLSSAISTLTLSDAWDPLTPIKSIHVLAALIWNRCKGADDARTGLLNRIMAPQPTLGVNALVCLRLLGDVVLNTYDMRRFAHAPDFNAPVSEGGAGGNVQRWQKSGNKQGFSASSHCLLMARLARKKADALRGIGAAEPAVRTEQRRTRTQRRVHSGGFTTARSLGKGRTPQRESKTGNGGEDGGGTKRSAGGDGVAELVRLREDYCPGSPVHVSWRPSEKDGVNPQIKYRVCRTCGKSCDFYCLFCEKAYCLKPVAPSSKNGYVIPDATTPLHRPGRQEGGKDDIMYYESCWHKAHRRGTDAAMAAANEAIDREMSPKDSGMGSSLSKRLQFSSS